MRELMPGETLSASTTAFTKKDMKPSFTPCRLRNSSCISLRSPMTVLMSHSLKVVRMAAVCWAMTSCESRSCGAAGSSSCAWCAGRPGRRSWASAKGGSCGFRSRCRRGCRNILLGSGRLGLGCGSGLGLGFGLRFRAVPRLLFPRQQVRVRPRRLRSMRRPGRS